MLFGTPIETERLLLRAETQEDVEVIYEMNTDTDLWRNLRWNNTR